jgi:NADH dehydrogenase
MREIVKTIAAALHKRRILAPLPLPLARIQARLFTAVMKKPPLTPATLELFGFDNITDLDAVDQTFGFHPRAFGEHIAAHGIEGLAA